MLTGYRVYIHIYPGFDVHHMETQPITITIFWSKQDSKI